MACKFPWGGRVATVLAAVTIFGCSGGDDSEEEASIEDFTCAFRVELTGAVDRDVPLEDLACGYGLSFDSGVSVVFIPLSEPTISISLDIDEMTKGEVGDFPARISIMDEDENRFVTNDCMVTVTTHEPDPEGEVDDFGAAYRLIGSGSCSTPAEGTTDSTQTVDVSDFEFAAPTSWGE